jgi:hypothetical protein
MHNGLIVDIPSPLELAKAMLLLVSKAIVHHILQSGLYSFVLCDAMLQEFVL